MACGCNQPIVQIMTVLLPRLLGVAGRPTPCTQRQICYLLNESFALNFYLAINKSEMGTQYTPLHCFNAVRCIFIRTVYVYGAVVAFIAFNFEFNMGLLHLRD